MKPCRPPRVPPPPTSVRCSSPARARSGVARSLRRCSWDPRRAPTPPRDAFLAFGGGARKCIGDTFGMTEATLALAAIAARRHPRPVPGHQCRPAPGAALTPRGRIRVTARPRPPAGHRSTTSIAGGDAVPPPHTAWFRRPELALWTSASPVRRRSRRASARGTWWNSRHAPRPKPVRTVSPPAAAGWLGPERSTIT
ncbi:cytochrome P450 [Streptomyces flavotricini]|uniref:Cytochrome P450 n=1 Tax=Streptomyces flavotricini TaxID=66888 RepID=A0ABS8DX83_9ACTN|nr:cytochrome P450 [Streptomyces flavotricini]